VLIDVEMSLACEKVGMWIAGWNQFDVQFVLACAHECVGTGKFPDSGSPPSSAGNDLVLVIIVVVIVQANSRFRVLLLS
jgi:hypothetical protein